jgi:hypothetical protein
MSAPVPAGPSYPGTGRPPAARLARDTLVRPLYRFVNRPTSAWGTTRTPGAFAGDPNRLSKLTNATKWLPRGSPVMLSAGHP